MTCDNEKPTPCNCTSGHCRTDGFYRTEYLPGTTEHPTITWTTTSGPEPASDLLDGTTEKFDACYSALMQIREYINTVPVDYSMDDHQHNQEVVGLAQKMEKQLLTAIQRYCMALTE